MKNKKMIVIASILLLSMFGNLNVVNAEIIINNKMYCNIYSGMGSEISVEAGDMVYWSFETYDHEFLIDPTIIYEDETNTSYGLSTKAQGVIAFWSAEIITLRFMNYDVHSGYMNLFIGLNEPPANKYVAITSVNCNNDWSLIDLSWEVRGFVFFVKIDLYYAYEFVTGMWDGQDIQCDIQNSANWGFDDNEDIFSGDKFHIKISDVDDPYVYKFSNYFTIELDDPVVPIVPVIIPSFNLLIIIGLIGSISVISAIIIRRRIHKIKPKI